MFQRLAWSKGVNGFRSICGETESMLDASDCDASYTDKSCLQNSV